MKVLIKHTLSAMNTRLHIEFNSEALISELRKIVSSKLGVPLSLIQLTTKKCGVVVLMTDFWPLSFFISSDVAVIKLNILESAAPRSELSINVLSQTQITRSRGLSKDIPAIDHLISISKMGSVMSLQDFLEVYENEIKDEDVLNQEQECKWGALHYACYYGHASIVEILVTLRVNCNKVSIDEWTPLQLSAYLNKAECVRVLLSHPNIQVNKVTKFRGTALHLACAQGNPAIVKMLLEKNAHIDIEDHMKRTPIEYAKTDEILDIIPVFVGLHQLKKLKSESEIPTSFCSEVFLTNSFMLNDRLVFLYMDVEHATLNRYARKEDFLDKKPAELYVKISDIQDVVYSESKDQYSFKIITSKSSIRYYSKHKELAQEWTSRLKSANEYSHINKPLEMERKNTEIEEEAVSEESVLTPSENIDYSSFTIMDEIGSGSFGTVYKVRRNTTGEIYAMKSLSKPTLQKHKQLKYAISECKIMKQLNHPFIVPLYYAFQTPKYLYLILELCPNGDLYGFIEKKTRLDESVARFYIAEVILALEYLHSLDIIYRDLKPANVLVDSFGHAKLADFGLAKEKMEKGNLAMTMAGSPAYLPPEIVLKKGASKASDIYGIGPLLFELLTGTTPYYCDDIDGLFQNIKSGKLSFPNYVTSTAKDFIISVMNRDPAKRPQITQIKRHNFFRKLDWEALLARRIRPPKLDFVNFEETNF